MAEHKHQCKFVYSIGTLYSTRFSWLQKGWYRGLVYEEAHLVSGMSSFMLLAWILHHAIVIPGLWRGNVWRKVLILTQACSLWKKSVCFSMLIHFMCCPGLLCVTGCCGPMEKKELYCSTKCWLVSGALLLIWNISAWLYSIYPFFSFCLFPQNVTWLHTSFWSKAWRSSSWFIPGHTCEIYIMWSYFPVSLTHPWHIHYVVA